MHPSARVFLTGGAAAALVAAVISAPSANADGFADTGVSPTMLATAYGVGSGSNTTVGGGDEPSADTAVPATADVTSPRDGTATESVAQADLGSDAGAGAMTVSATADPDTATDGAKSTVANLLIPDLVSAEVVRSTCAATPSDLTGSALLAELKVGGSNDVLDATPEPNTVIDLPGIGSVTLNEQSTDVVGNDLVLTVNAIDIRLDTTQDGVHSTADRTIIGHTTCRTTAASSDSMTPTQGPSDGGTEVTITGDHLTDVSEVVFGDDAGTDLIVNSPAQLTVRTPAHRPERVPVTLVTGTGASSTKTFTFIETPDTGNVNAPGQFNGGTPDSGAGSGSGGDDTGNTNAPGQFNDGPSDSSADSGNLPHTGFPLAPLGAAALLAIVAGAHLTRVKRQLTFAPLTVEF